MTAEHSARAPGGGCGRGTDHGDARARAVGPECAECQKELGGRLREYRCRAGLTQVDLARAVVISDRHLRRIERGDRRTRRSTLRRFADVLGARLDCNPQKIFEDLLVAAGPALAPETAFPERVDARRNRRQAHVHANQHRRRVTQTVYVIGGSFERRITDLPRGTSGRRVTVRYLYRPDGGRAIIVPATCEVARLFHSVEMPAPLHPVTQRPSPRST